jgi:hypothetical protein
MRAIHAVELVPGIGWAAFWIYWLVTTLTSKRRRLANAAEHSDDDQLGALVCLIASSTASMASPISPQVTTHPVSADKGMRLPWSRSRVQRSLLGPQAG